MKDKTIFLLLLILLISIVALLNSCASDDDVLDLQFFNEQFKLENSDYFPVSETPRDFAYMYSLVSGGDGRYSETYHYKQYLYPNRGIKPSLEKHNFVLEYCDMPKAVRSNGCYYHWVSYSCPYCQLVIERYLLCRNQTDDCDGSCINFGNDYSPGMED